MLDCRPGMRSKRLPHSWRSRVVYSCFFVYLFTSTALRGTGDNNQTGFHDSPSFQLDTHDPNPMDSIGFADSGGFELNTGGHDGTLQSGIGDTGGFELNTQDSPGGNGDMNNTGFADSGGFQLDTADGNTTFFDSNQTGFADSGGFNIDTRDPNPMDSIGFADSGGFELNTSGHDGTERTGFSDSGGFSLNTVDAYGSTSDQNSTGFADSSGFDLDTTDSGNQQNQNAPPSFQSDGNLTVPENSTFVYEFNATDPDGDSLSYSIEYGDDQHLFDLNTTSGALSFFTHRDFENPEDNNSDNIYEATIQVSDGNATALLNLFVHVTNMFENDAPSFQSDGNLSVYENQTFVYEFNATDPNGDYLTYSILYGDDANAFDLNGSTGILSFISPRDYENPDDNDSDNIYEATIQVSDGNATALLNLFVHVTDMFENDAPSFQSDGNLSVYENQTFVYEFNATDPNGDILSYSILHGPDANLFDLNQSSGALTFISPKDYEAPEDNNTDNVYQLTIQVADSGTPVSLNLNIEVTDVFENAPPSFQSDGNLTVSENTTFVYEFNATDPDGDVLTYSILYGPDSSLFDLNQSSGSLTFFSPKDFEAPEDNNTDNVYHLTIQVAGNGTPVSLNLNIEVTDVFENAPPSFQSDGNLNIPENTTFIYEFNATDPNGDPLSYSIKHGDDQQFFELNSSMGTLSFITPKDFENPEDNNRDNVYELSLIVSDEFDTAPLNLFVQVTDIFEADFDSFDPLQIEENSPVGSLVGHFDAINIEPHEAFSYSLLSFDENPLHIQDRIMELEALSLDVLKSQEEIDAYQVEIIELQERIELAKSNGLFFVDQNGSLRTNQILDYEAFYEHPFLPILVQAIDEHNFTITKHFVIEVTDEQFEPDFDTFDPLQIEENRPVGSLVGHFNAINIEPHEFFSYFVLSFEDDPVQIQERIFELETLSLDVLKSPEEIDAYQVEIIELQERIELAKSNGLFFVDQNGSLRTNQVLDYEAFYEHPVLPILVQATDEHNFTITKHFMIEVTDEQFEPDFDTFGLLQIEVNRPVGSLVGQFNASNIEPHEFFSYSVLSFEDDPVQIQERIFELETLSLDVLKSPEEIDAYQVEIIELQERIELAKSNGLFFVDQNGSLRTNQILDYETFSEHPFVPILVQATDEHNFTITKYFMVEVIDRVTEPVTPLPAIVRTFNSADINEFSYLLEAEVLADGGSLIQEAGFLISKSIRFIDPIRIIALLDPLTGEFAAEFVDFEPGTRYYFRGYAFNDFGESKGSIKKFRTPEIVDPDAWWNNMTDVGGGWRNSEWFGAFLTYPELDWIYHSDLDWVYVVKDEGNGIWIWHPQHGWLWTQDMVWPYLYSNRTSNWIYFMNKINGQPIFYDYETGRYLLDFKSPTDF